jgi:hypothetical protein
MALSVFLVGVVFIHSLTRRVVTPLEEIHTVITAHRNGETMRRCTGIDLAQDVAMVFSGINEILDRSSNSSVFSLNDEFGSRHGSASSIFHPDRSGDNKDNLTSQPSI